MRKELMITKLTPNTGRVYAMTPFGGYYGITDEIPLADCRAFVLTHQRDLRTFKVTATSARKDARRRLHCKIYAPSEEDAVGIFVKLAAGDLSGKRLDLYTGDWKLIASGEDYDFEKEKEN